MASLLTLAKIEAHPIPTMTVEAEFHHDGSCDLRVNMDPRLFLHAVPSTLPPVPGSWWWDQNPADQAKTTDNALQYLARTLRFQLGDTGLMPKWEVRPIDSTLTTDLSPTSAEVHLLARSRVAIPHPPGDFKVVLDRSAAVPMILLNSETGNPKVAPQSVYPGESSRAFTPPATSGPQPTAPAASTPLSEAQKAPSPPAFGWRLAIAATLLLSLLVVMAIHRRHSAGEVR
ncbi:MAG: hypothetical protein ACAI34_04100 [Verrucomicrobium sp.]